MFVISADGESSSDGSQHYKEFLYCQLYDSERTRLADALYKKDSAKCSALEVVFNRPAYLKRNTPYRILVLFQRAGTYSHATASSEEISEDVRFKFGPTSNDPFPVIAGTRDGVIRGVIYSFGETS